MQWWQIRRKHADLERELCSDLELEEEEQRRTGLSPEDARYAALRAFGNPALIRDETREAWGWAPLERLTQDLRYAVHLLMRSPGFTITCVLILETGIGATTAIFSLVNAVLLRPLPFPESDRLVWVSRQDHSLPGVVPESLSYPDYSLSDGCLLSPFLLSGSCLLSDSLFLRSSFLRSFAGCCLNKYFRSICITSSKSNGFPM